MDNVEDVTTPPSAPAAAMPLVVPEVPEAREVREVRERPPTSAGPSGVALSAVGSQSSLPDLSEAQFRFLTHRLSGETDHDSLRLAGVSEADFLTWLGNTDFRRAWDACRTNKRAAVALLGSQLMPKVLRVLYDLLDSENQKSRLLACQLLLRSQGLLIDRKETISADVLRDLVAQLREAGPMTIIDVTPRE